jgi:hypothetical protein
MLMMMVFQGSNLGREKKRRNINLLSKWEMNAMLSQGG